MAIKKAIFVDRGGVIHDDFTRHTTGKPNDLVLNYSALVALKAIDRNQFRVFITDNPDGVAMGEYSELAYKRLTNRLMNILRRKRIQIDGWYTCLQHPQGKGKYRKESVFRYPNVGIFKQAQQEYELDLTMSWVIGDSTRELLAAQRACCKTVLVQTGKAGKDGEYYVEPECVAQNLREAVKFIHQQELALTR